MPGRRLKAVIPGGSSAKVMRADDVYKIKKARMPKAKWWTRK